YPPRRRRRRPRRAGRDSCRPGAWRISRRRRGRKKGRFSTGLGAPRGDLCPSLWPGNPLRMPPLHRERVPMAFKAGKLVVLGFAGLVLSAGLAGCDKKQQAAAPAASLNAADVEKWSDEAFGKILAEHRVSALAISVTEGDKLVFTKGYGYADWNGK